MSEDHTSPTTADAAESPMETPRVPVVDHGPELDAAMSNTADPEDLGVCPTALHDRISRLTKMQMDGAIRERGQTRDELIANGMSPNEAEATASVIEVKTAIGGAFSYGIAVGLKLAENRLIRALAEAKSETVRDAWETEGHVGVRQSQENEACAPHQFVHTPEDGVLCATCGKEGTDDDLRPA